MAILLDFRPNETGYTFGTALDDEGLTCPVCRSDAIALNSFNQLVCLGCEEHINVGRDKKSQTKLAVSLINHAYYMYVIRHKAELPAMELAGSTLDQLQEKSNKISYLVYMLCWLYFLIYQPDDPKKAIAYAKKGISALREYARDKKEDFTSCFLLARACTQLGEYIQARGSQKEKALCEKLFRQAIQWMEKAYQKGVGINKSAARSSLQPALTSLIYELDEQNPDYDKLLVHLSDLLLDNKVTPDYVQISFNRQEKHPALFTAMSRDFPRLIEIFSQAKSPRRFEKTAEALMGYMEELQSMDPDDPERLNLLLETWLRAAGYFYTIKEMDRAIEIEKKALDFHQDLDFDEFEAREKFEIMNKGLVLYKDLANFYKQVKEYEKSKETLAQAKELLDQIQEDFEGDYLDNFELRIMILTMADELMLGNMDKAQKMLPEMLKKLDAFKKNYPESSFLEEIEEMSDEIERSIAQMSVAAAFKGWK